jgi:transposase
VRRGHIEKLLEKQVEADEGKREPKAEAKPYKRVDKGAPQHMDLNQPAFQCFNGVDLMSVEGVSHGTVVALMSEVGQEGIRRFASAKQFASWLRLCPNTKASGGKVLSSKIPKGSNRLWDRPAASGQRRRQPTRHAPVEHLWPGLLPAGPHGGRVGHGP